MTAAFQAPCCLPQTRQSIHNATGLTSFTARARSSGRGRPGHCHSVRVEPCISTNSTTDVLFCMKSSTTTSSEADTGPQSTLSPMQSPSTSQSHSQSQSQSQSQSASRRNFLTKALLTSLGLLPGFMTSTTTTSPKHPFLNIPDANAYSSPYRPGENPTPLPDRLYERPAAAIVTTATGLQYFDLAAGATTSGAAAKGDTVVVNYTSRLRGLNGIKIDSSFETDAPFVFRIGAPDVVPGVSEAVMGMHVGGKRRAVLPPDIAYASPDMKPAVTEFFARRRLLSVLETNRDATIVFDLELLKIKS